MEFNDESMSSNAMEMIPSEDERDDLLATKVAELEKMKEDLRQAKDDAMQSWLDSRPIIDELEKMQAELASAKARVLKANTTISELQAQLGTTDMCFKSTKEEEERFRVVINENSQALHKAQEDLEQLKVKIDEKRRRRSKLKIFLRSKRQNLQTLQLTYEAIVLETEAFSTSAAQAFSHINNSDAANIMVQIPVDEYEFLKREANEQNSIAEWRIAVAREEKLAAENSREAAFRRLRNLYPLNNYGIRNMAEQRPVGRTEIIEEMADTGRGKPNRTIRFAAARPKSAVNRRNPPQQHTNRNYGNSRKKRKSSILVRIKTFFVLKLSKYFK